LPDSKSMNSLVVFNALFLLASFDVHAVPALIPDGGYPSFESTPDEISIGILGSELTKELAGHKFDKKALGDVIDKVIYKADLDGDSLLDRKELALWLHKNEQINKAAEVKGDFWDHDENEDSQITFQEFGLNGGLDHITRTEFKNRFILDDNKLNYALLEEDHPVLDEHGGPSLEGIISRLYRVFKAVDGNKDEALNWEEFIAFSYPEDIEEISMLASGQKYRKFDEDHDERYCINEFRKYYNKHITIPELLPLEYRTPDRMFDACDKNKDGFLSFEESDDCFKGHIAIDHREPEWLIEDGDKNGDDKLSKEEIVDEFNTLTEDDDYWGDHRDEL